MARVSPPKERPDEPDEVEIEMFASGSEPSLPTMGMWIELNLVGLLTRISVGGMSPEAMVVNAVASPIVSYDNDGTILLANPVSLP